MISLTEARDSILEGLAKQELVLVLGNCKVKYSGRAASKLSEGDRLLVVKPDGTFLVHQKSKMAAINYQGPGSVTSVFLDKLLVIKSERKKPVEFIEASFNSIKFVGCFSMSDDNKLELIGSEKQLADELMLDLSLIEKGLKPLQKESFMQKGSIDVLAEDSAGNLVVIELKRRSAGLDAVTQLKRYVEELQKRKGRRVRGILCSPEITDNALKMLYSDGFEYFKLDYESSSAKIKGLQRKQKELSEY
ncbi:endonuclease NucS [Candidatus Micrarchaeota archaeon]|nr:endonuclease NucS [Candidatus Micrarchaeota archaeon]